MPFQHKAVWISIVDSLNSLVEGAKKPRHEIECKEAYSVGSGWEELIMRPIQFNLVPRYTSRIFDPLLLRDWEQPLGRKVFV